MEHLNMEELKSPYTQDRMIGDALSLTPDNEESSEIVSSTASPLARDTLFANAIAPEREAETVAGSPMTSDRILSDAVKTARSAGPAIEVIPLTVTENTTYTAEEGKAFNPVVGNVANTYTAEDEGKVVSDGALVEQGILSVFENGDVDTTLIKTLNVSVEQAQLRTQAGKLNNPFGETISFLAVISGNNANETVGITFNFNGGTYELLLTGRINGGGVQSLKFTGSELTGAALDNFLAICYTYDPDQETWDAAAEQTTISGSTATVTDLSSYLSTIDSVLTMIWHPVSAQ